MEKSVFLLQLLLASFSADNTLAFEWHPAPGCRWAALPVPVTGRTGFTELSPQETGIFFTNSLPQQRYLTNQILLNGSGVAAGDIDGDGKCDLFFCGIDRPCALYRNLGDWKFADITAEAGVACAGQPSTGAVFADVDGNGTLDLLVNGMGTGTRLFLNDGTGHFHEVTSQWGLRGGTGSMSMALADIDGDGYLDLYVANYRTTTFRDELDARFKASVTNNHYEIIAVNGRPTTEPDLVGRFSLDPVTGILENGEADVLYHNSGHGKFVPLSWTDGTFLDEDGRPSKVPYDWGLSVMFRDLNGDGAPDIYVCNDFHSPDRIWINDGHGRFRAVPRLAIRQTSIFSMGIDVADIDRDGHDDLFVADMLSRLHASRQVQLMDRQPMRWPIGQIDSRPQYSRNTLFWNRGDDTYAEIAQYGGVEASEWTWCPVFLDVDLDGFEDLLMVTGHVRDAQNIDISRHIEALRRQKPMSKLEQLNLRKLFTKLDVPNLAFRNRGDLTFEEVGAAWGFNSRRVSQGIALADLDNDGDLDVVVNCLEDGPLILRNDSNRPRVAVRLRGLPPNTRGIGSKVKVIQAGLPAQSQEIMCGGHYLSGDDPLRVFAAANSDTDLTIEVDWRSGRRSVITHAQANRIYEIDEAQAQPSQRPIPVQPLPLFTDASGLLGHRHRQEEYNDYQRQPLLPFKLSQLGPGVSWFDYDGDGWEDLIVAGGRGGQLAVFHNDGKGGFAPVHEPLFDSLLARGQTTILGCVTQTNHHLLLAGSSNYEDGLTNGAAALVYDLESKSVLDVLPGQAACTGPLALADMEGEGHLDLFIGGRVVPGRFPEPAPSLLFRNVHGKFEMDRDACAAFARLGCVSGAIWSDLDGDGRPELIVACQGGPIRVFRWEPGRVHELTAALGLEKYLGLWNSVSVGDFDGDGRLDIVAGNWGRNTKYQSFRSQPIHYYYGDLGREGYLEVVEACYDKDLNRIVPFRDWETLATAMPFIKERYHSFTEFSRAGVGDFMGERMARLADLPLNTLESMVFLNRGDHFEARPLPREAQFAPVFGLSVGDLDGDGNEDVFVCQNFFDVPPQTSRMDAGRSVWLKGNGQGDFVAVPGQVSGLKVYGEGRGAALCDYDHDGRLDLVVGQNSAVTRLYHNTGAKPGLRIVLHGPVGNRAEIGAVIRLQYRDGHLGPAREVHAGGGYWSQDAATQVLGVGGEVDSVVVRWPRGNLTKTPVPPNTRELWIGFPAQGTKGL